MDFLNRVRGVEVIDCAIMTTSMQSVYCIRHNIQDGERLYNHDLEFNKDSHICVSALTSECEGAYYEESILKSINELRQLLKGERPGSYRDLALPIGYYSRTLRIDKFPVRIVVAYEPIRVGYITTLDTYRPATYEPML